MADPTASSAVGAGLLGSLLVMLLDEARDICTTPLALPETMAVE